MRRRSGGRMAGTRFQEEPVPDGFGISEYPDVPAVIADLDALIAQPIRPLRREALDAYLEDHFEKRCQSSKAMTAVAAEYIPGGVQHNLAFNMPFPLVITRASGCHLTDLDGNEYLDFLQAGGPTVLGSNPPEVLEQVIDLLRTCGPSTGLFHEYELKLARFIAEHMPAVPMYRMLGAGTESGSRALGGSLQRMFLEGLGYVLQWAAGDGGATPTRLPLAGLRRITRSGSTASGEATQTPPKEGRPSHSAISVTENTSGASTSRSTSLTERVVAGATAVVSAEGPVRPGACRCPKGLPSP